MISSLGALFCFLSVRGPSPSPQSYDYLLIAHSLCWKNISIPLDCAELNGCATMIRQRTCSDDSAGCSHSKKHSLSAQSRRPRTGPGTHGERTSVAARVPIPPARSSSRLHRTGARRLKTFKKQIADTTRGTMRRLHRGGTGPRFVVHSPIVRIHCRGTRAESMR